MKTLFRTYWDYKSVEEVLDYMEFELLISTDEEGETCLKLHDLQGANLSNIEDETFYDFAEVMDRLSGGYLEDYYISPTLEEFQDRLEDWSSLDDLCSQLLSLPECEIEDWLWDINIIQLFSNCN